MHTTRQYKNQSLGLDTSEPRTTATTAIPAAGKTGRLLAGALTVTAGTLLSTQQAHSQQLLMPAQQQLSQQQELQLQLPQMQPLDGALFNAEELVNSDDNVYRLPSGTLLPPGERSSDYVSHTSVGSTLQKSLYRQVFLLDVQLSENRYRHNGNLDNTSGYVIGGWSWESGKHWSGVFQAEYQRFLASFANTLYRRRDVVSTTDYSGEVQYQIGARWALTAGGTFDKNAHGAHDTRDDDVNKVGENLGILYMTPSGNSVAWKVSHQYVEFPGLAGCDTSSAGEHTDCGSSGSEPATGGALATHYSDKSTQLEVKYAPTLITRFDLQGGYLRRDYPTGASGSFSGEVWRAEAKWFPTADSQVVLSDWRELHAYLEAESNYFVSDGLGAAVLWNFTRFLDGSLNYTRERQRFPTDALTRFQPVERHDISQVGQVKLEYHSPRNIFLTLGFTLEHRTSTSDFFNYTSRMVSLGLRVEI